MEVATMDVRPSGPLTISDCDRQLATLVARLQSARRRGDSWAAERWLLDIDQWLDARNTLTERERRRRAQGPRGL